MNSCNHVMILGDLLTWYFRDLAGFNPAQPAYKQIILKPDFSIQELSHVKASHNTLYGKMISNWKKTLTHLEWDITVPCNTTALVYLPTLDEKAVKDKDVTFVRREGNSTVWSVPSGNYHFRLAWTLLQVKPCRYRGRSVPIRTSFFSRMPRRYYCGIEERRPGSLFLWRH